MVTSTLTGAKRTSPGCWTCKARRKRCDLKSPICDACAGLEIPCHNGSEKPPWMDNGVRQEEMAESLKHMIKENAHRRRGERAVNVTSDQNGHSDSSSSGWTMLSRQQPSVNESSSRCDIPADPSHLSGQRSKSVTKSTTLGEPLTKPQEAALYDRVTGEPFGFGRSDTILMMFYLETVFPFLYPFYQPSILNGGRAWLLEMMLSSPVVRQAMLCQSSYYLSLARGTAIHHNTWETVLAQTEETFSVLGKALQVMKNPGIHEHMPGAIRILASIIQLQRFEIAISSFGNCQAHLGAAIALFGEMLECGRQGNPTTVATCFQNVLDELGSQAWGRSNQHVAVPSAERAALCFSSSLLLFDDIIASTVLQERPRLYDCHKDLLCKGNACRSALDLEDVVGCQNWVLLQIGEIAVLDAWKQECIRLGNLDVMQLVRRAMPILTLLQESLADMDHESLNEVTDNNDRQAGGALNSRCSSGISRIQIRTVTRVWAYAAHIYLSVVMSGWQPASTEIRCHVNKILDVLSQDISPKIPLQTVAWPFCVAGCLAEPGLHLRFKQIVELVPALSMSGTVRQALEVMETVWQHQEAGTAVNLDLAACFRLHDEMILLV